MTDFNNKQVLITGAGGGIGGALCSHFIDKGASIIALDKDERVAELADSNTLTLVVDISDHAKVTAAIQNVIKQTGDIDILINNAAIATAGTFASTSIESWQREIDVDLNGVYYCTQAVLPTMQSRNQGAIVTIGSVNGLTTLGHPAYSAAKAGLISFTKFLAVEYGRFGIRSNMICPGTVRTPAWQKRVEQQPEIFEQLRKWYPLGRVAEPIDIAKAVAFLASDDASIITGSILTVDGGLMAGNAVMTAELTLEEF